MKCLILAVTAFSYCLGLHAGELVPKGTIIPCTTTSPLRVGRELGAAQCMVWLLIEDVLHDRY